MNNMELVTDVPVIEMELDVVTRNYPVIPNPEGTPTDDISSMEIDNVIYAVKDETARTELDNKVDKVEGKGLSEEDFTHTLKAKLDGIENGAEVNVQVDWFENDNSKDDFIKNKPTKLSDFDNDEGFIDNSVNNLENYYKKSETYTNTEINSALDGKADKSDTYTKSEVDSALENKVNKDGDKVLSDNNYSDTDKTKLDGIEAEANKTVVDNSVTSTSTNPVESKAIYNMLNDLLPEATATGNPIAITNASGLNAKSLKVELEPIQDLHGYDSPWVGGAGKNKLPTTVDSIKSIAQDTAITWNDKTATYLGVTFEIQTDTNENVIGIKANGTASADCYFKVAVNFPLTAGSYKLSGCPSSGSWDSYVLYGRGANNENYGSDTGSGKDVTLATDVTVAIVVIFIKSGYNASNLIFKPMYCLLSASEPSVFAPYSNICPISGRTQTTVSVNSEDTTIQFVQTVYGGTCDVVNGGTIPNFYIEFDGSNDETWEIYNVTQGKLFRTSSSHRKTGVELYALNAFCNSYKITSQGQRADGTLSGGAWAGQYGTLDFIDNRFSSLDQWKANLSSNPIQVCFDDRIPTTINTPATEISLNKANNTLTADGDMELIYSKTPQ